WRVEPILERCDYGRHPWQISRQESDRVAVNGRGHFTRRGLGFITAEAANGRRANHSGVAFGGYAETGKEAKADGKRESRSGAIAGGVCRGRPFATRTEPSDGRSSLLCAK